MARRRYVSIKEVAARAGVSFQTASKVLNGGGVRVSAQTAERILAAAGSEVAELLRRYVPSVSLQPAPGGGVPMAIGVLSALWQTGRRVPADVAAAQHRGRAGARADAAAAGGTHGV